MASGKIMGTTTGNSASLYDFWVDWSATAYPQGAYSLVSATAYLQRNDGYAGSAYNLDISASNKYISVAGTKKNSTKNGIDTRNSAKVVIGSISQQKVLHDSTGYATINISAAFPRVSSNLTGGNLSKNVTLDKIDVKPLTVAPQVLSASQNSIEFGIVTSENADKWWFKNNTISNQWFDIYGLNTPSKQVSVTLTGLSPNTNYSFAFKARKASTQVEYSSENISAKTLPIYATDIQIDNAIDVAIGEEKTLEYTILPATTSIKTINAVSDNTNVVIISGNKIAGISKGTATITVSTTDGSGISKEITVNVVKKVSGLSLPVTDITIPKGDSAQVFYSIIPSDASNQNVVLSSSDDLIVSISGNTMIGVENGKAIVTVTTEDGGFTSQLSVNVVGEFVWYDYSKPIDILNSEDVEHISSNIKTIRAMLLLKNYDVPDLKDMEATKSIEFLQIFDILSNIEYNLDVISNQGVLSIYYGEPVIIGDYASNKEDIWRWIQILNDMYNMLNNGYGKWQYLLGNDGYPTINGKKILVRGEIIG